MRRCEWPGEDRLYQRYHDREWGVPLHNDRKLYEFLVLEGAQAGLSWITILRKRDNYRRAFDRFDFNKVAEYGEREVKRLLKDSGIVRNERKIRSAINNARAFLEVRREFGTFNNYIWDFVGGEPIQNARRGMRDIPARTPLSDEISRELKRRGFSFVGSTIVYSHMQATGMVNDHAVYCFRHAEIKRLAGG
jgi:DNA-3-methyladenine glycosylase I